MDVISVSFYIFDESEVITDNDWLMYDIATVAMPIFSILSILTTSIMGFTTNRKPQGWGAIVSIPMGIVVIVVANILYWTYYWG